MSSSSMTGSSRVVYFLEKCLSPTGANGTVVCSGWIFPVNGGNCGAVRAKQARQITLAVSHLPRPDVAASYPTEISATHSGFLVTLTGLTRAPVCLEWMDGAGQWHEFWRESRASASPRPWRNPRPVLPDSLLPDFLTATVAVTRGKSWRESWQLIGELLESWTSRTTAMPASPDCYAHLDEPRSELCAGEFLPVSGWVFARGAAIRRIFAQAEPGGAVHLIYPLQRPDVRAAYPDLPVPLACGFSGMIKLPGRATSLFYFRLYAESSDGTRRLVFARRYIRSPPAGDDRVNRHAAIRMTTLAFAGRYRPQSWSALRQALARLIHRTISSSGPISASSSRQVFPEGSLLTVSPREGDPLISILVPVFNPPGRYLEEMIASVRTQSYPRWELCLADDASTATHVRPLIEDYARLEARIRPVFRGENGQIARATNSALALAQGEFIALLDHDDKLAPDALLRVVEAIRQHPEVQFLYTDRDKFNDHGRHFDVELRGDWNPAMALTHNYLHQLTVIRRRLMDRVGGFRAEYFGSQDLDLYLRCHELIEADQIVHVPVVAYHWRAHAGSTASRGDQKDYMYASARRGITDALTRRHLQAEPFLPEFATFYGLNLHQLRWSPNLLRENPVSIVLSVATPGEAWQRTAAALLSTVPRASVQLIVVANEVHDPIKDLHGADPITFITTTADTCAAARFNLGAAHARHALLLLLAANATPRTSGWLEDLTGWSTVPGVLAVGPKLINDENLLHSAGCTVSQITGLPEAWCAGAPPDDPGWLFLPHAARDSLLLDSPVLLTRTTDFLALGGYDHARFPSFHFAADYCLRVHERKKRVVFTPQAVFQLATTTPGNETARTQEDATFHQAYPRLKDSWIRPQSTPSETLGGQSSPPSHTWMPGDTIEFFGGWFHLELPRPGEELSAGTQVLSGWCLPRTDHGLNELRLQLGKQIHPITYGHPRRDLAAVTGDAGEFLPVGFDLELELPSGQVRLDFEAMGADGIWGAVDSMEWTVAPPRRTSGHRLRAAVSVAQLAEGVKLLLAPAAEERLDRRALALAQSFPWRDAVRSPALPFHGYLDLPTEIVRPVYGGTFVSGWLFHETLAIRRVVASFVLNDWLQLTHQNDSSLICGNFARFPNARKCAVVGFVPVPTTALRQPLALRLWAELEDGGWHLVYVRRCALWPGGGAHPPPAQTVRWHALVAAVLAFRWALWRSDLPGPGLLSLWSASQLVRQQFPRAGSTAMPGLPPLPPAPEPSPPHVLLVTHNLNQEGAPYFLLELALYVQKHTRARFTVVSTFPGPLQQEFERHGMNVRLVDRGPLWKARNRRAAHHALVALARELQAQAASLIVANTIESFWAVHAARQAGRPALFYIHEPGVFGLHYLGDLGPETRKLAATALAQTNTLVSFPSKATQAYYEGFSPSGNHRIQIGWTDLDRLLPLVGPGTRDLVRTRLQLHPDEPLVINVGTICERKGQLSFINAIEHLWRTQPRLAATCQFLLIGAQEGDYGRMLAAHVSKLQRPNIAIFPATPQIGEYFAAADLFVLSSYEEGFPRVLLEAMGFGLAIVTTAIHAIPEITRDGEEALLVPPGDSHAIANKMQFLLEHREFARELGRRAQVRCRTNFTADRVLPGHLKTMLELVPNLAVTVPKIPAPDLPESNRVAL